MTAAEIDQIIQNAIKDGYHFPWWQYLIAAIITFVGAFLGSYLKKRAENLATKNDFDSLLIQVKKTTTETEGIKVELAKGTWLHQQRWNLKEKYYSGLLNALFILKQSLIDRLDYYIEPGSEYKDNEISKSDQFKALGELGYTAVKKIKELHSPAEIVISDRAIEALEMFYNEKWEASEFSACNNDYLKDMYQSVKKVHKIMLEEARLELR